MYIYRFEVTIKERIVNVIIVANSDEIAFKYVDIELEKHYVKLPEIDDITLHEKRKIRHAGGYVLEHK